MACGFQHPPKSPLCSHISEPVASDVLLYSSLPANRRANRTSGGYSQPLIAQDPLFSPPRAAMFVYPAYLANFLGGTLKHCGFCHTHTVLFGDRKQQVSKTTAVRRRLKQGKAHSDIFLCGQSHDAMLATGVYSVIKKKKGVAESFSSTFEKTSSYPSTR